MSEPGSGSGARRLDAFAAEVLGRGEFTRDWFTRNVDDLEPLVAALEGRPARLLEIGSFEGLSSCYFLWRLPQAHLTCVDTFRGSPGLPSGDRDAIEDAFDRNVALVDATRVRKLVGDSRRVLLDLAGEAGSFDLVYVDGSHRGLDVLVDAALSWPLVALGGVVVFDDYRWALLGDDALLRPGPAIDAFLGLVAGHSELVRRDRQVVVRRVRDPVERPRAAQAGGPGGT